MQTYVIRNRRTGAEIAGEVGDGKAKSHCEAMTDDLRSGRTWRDPDLQRAYTADPDAYPFLKPCRRTRRIIGLPTCSTRRWNA